MGEYKVHVGNLSYDTDERSLQDYFTNERFEVVEGKYFKKGIINDNLHA